MEFDTSEPKIEDRCGNNSELPTADDGARTRPGRMAGEVEASLLSWAKWFPLDQEVEMLS